MPACGIYGAPAHVPACGIRSCCRVLLPIQENHSPPGDPGLDRDPHHRPAAGPSAQQLDSHQQKGRQCTEGSPGPRPDIPAHNPAGERPTLKRGPFSAEVFSASGNGCFVCCCYRDLILSVNNKLM